MITQCIVYWNIDINIAFDQTFPFPFDNLPDDALLYILCKFISLLSIWSLSMYYCIQTLVSKIMEYQVQEQRKIYFSAATMRSCNPSFINRKRRNKPAFSKMISSHDRINNFRFWKRFFLS